MDPSQFSDLCIKIKARVEANEPLKMMLEWLKSQQGFVHTRINDGESICMFGLSPPTDRNNCGHYYYTDLGVALRQMVLEIVNKMRANPQSRILLGGYWYTQGYKESDLDEPAQALVKFCSNCLDELPWGGSDDIVRGLTTDLPYQIFDYIRESGRPVYLIANPRNEPGRHCLGAKFIPISRTDCWHDTARIIQTCRVLCHNENPPIFIWCCGMAKSWAWDLWNQYPNSSHIDAGHLFDAAFGEHSREYTRRRDRTEERWRHYEDRFIPYCHSFVPAGGR